jgi:hypothetical protein
MAETAATLAQPVVVTLAPIADIDAATEIQQPSPVDVDVPAVDNKISISSVAAPAAVSYTPISTTDAVTNETLNQTAETLKVDINAKLTTFATNVSNALADAGTDLTAQVSEINSVLSNLKSDINAAFLEVRNKEVEQTSDITVAVNARLASLVSNLTALQTGLTAVDAKVIALDDVYGTDADISSKVTAINALISSLRAADLDVVAALDGSIDELNSLTRVTRKKMTINAGSGERVIDTVLDGFGEFLAPGDYVVDAEVTGNRHAYVLVSEQTAAGFKLSAFSQGVHFLPQPWPADVTPVDVVVTVSHAKRNPMTFNVDTLNSSFVTDGSGTDANTVGA